MAETKESMLIAEIEKKYAGEWVAVKVIERDNAGQPLRVKVIAHHSDRFKVKGDTANEREVCLFLAGSIPRPGFELMF